jgi:hypothetical protein
MVIKTEVKLEMVAGSIVGYEAIQNQLMKLGLLFEMDFRRWADDWMTRHFPQLTRRLKETILNTMVIIHDLIVVKGDFVEYSKYVETMTGVNWTNPSTMEQPFENLRLFALKAIVDIYVEIGETLGFKITRG